MKSKAYRALDVNHLDVDALVQHRDEELVHAGFDVDKERILSVLRWGTRDFDRPWRLRNPAYLSLALTQFFRERPQLRMRCVVPIQRNGDTVELHAWLDLCIFPDLSGKKPEKVK